MQPHFGEHCPSSSRWYRHFTLEMISARREDPAVMALPNKALSAPDILLKGKETQAATAARDPGMPNPCMTGGPLVSGILLVWCTGLLGAASYSCCLMVLREGAEALEGGGPLTCEGRLECLAEERAECMVAERAFRGASGAGSAPSVFCVGSSIGKAFSFCCFGMGGSAANLCSQ